MYTIKEYYICTTYVCKICVAHMYKYYCVNITDLHFFYYLKHVFEVIIIVTYIFHYSIVFKKSFYTEININPWQKKDTFIKYKNDTSNIIQY